MTDHRREGRPRALLAGLIVFEGGARSIGCAIRDISSGGAKVEFAATELLPASVWLIEIRKGVAHQCRIAWTRDTLRGLQFLSSTSLQQADTVEMKTMRRLWIERIPR